MTLDTMSRKDRKMLGLKKVVEYVRELVAGDIVALEKSRKDAVAAYKEAKSELDDRTDACTRLHRENQRLRADLNKAVRAIDRFTTEGIERPDRRWNKVWLKMHRNAFSHLVDVYCSITDRHTTIPPYFPSEGNLERAAKAGEVSDPSRFKMGPGPQCVFDHEGGIVRVRMNGEFYGEIPIEEFNRLGGSESSYHPVKIDYVNWRGERYVRSVEPQSIWFGSTKFHPEKQWLMKARGEDGALKDYAMKDIKSWGQAPGEQDPKVEAPQKDP